MLVIIDDNEMNLKEITGKIDRIQEDLQNLLQLIQESHAPGAVIQKMKEESITHPVGFQGKLKWFSLSLSFFAYY